MRRSGTALALTLLLGSTLVSGPAPASPAAPDRASASPALVVGRQVTGLSVPWDVQLLPSGQLLISERSNKRLILATGNTKRVLRFPTSTVWASGETGLMGLAVDPDFSTNRRIYTCQGAPRVGGGHDVRVIAWRLDTSLSTVTPARVLVSGLPSTSGRHGGCRLLIARGGALLVGTGDAATGTNPQNLRSLGGKTLRLNRLTGAPWPTNRWKSAASRAQRYVFTYGHRNVQGLAQRADGTLWSVEQGTDRDDEVNRLTVGGNYGWNPVPGYNESRPMTDQALPGTQLGARWSSGDPTLATSGGTWVSGTQWGDLNGTLAVAALKDGSVTFLKFDSVGRLLWSRKPAALQNFGRLRSITKARNGDLLITTSNESNDAVLRVRPAG